MVELPCCVAIDSLLASRCVAKYFIQAASCHMMLQACWVIKTITQVLGDQ